MSTSYSQPLSLGWKRMKKALFQPFDINKWFRIGFTAWLAGMTDCHGGSGGNNSGKNFNDPWDELFNFPQNAWNWLMDNPLWFNLIIVGIVLIIIIATIIIWISSRGKFMFLYNVVHDSSDISKPWHEFSKEGNSLFFFQFFYGWIASAAFIAFAVYCFITAKTLYYGDFPNIAIFWSVALMILIFIGLMIVFGYISLFLKDFVVPIMYKNRIGVMRGWSKFMQLLFRRFFSFIGYGLFIFILGIAVAIGVILLALMTCCIGLMLIAIPYIGAVLLLPVSYTFRAFSIEFLRQFGSEYDVFPQPETDNPEIEAN